ncbi:MAG: hypothetical protein PHW32_00920 [Bacilli bacterium]|nr:hypothetical protein [Bacilli bacterium]MDD4282853.1 hypothetical protein [Bacilli bacterium]MDD4718680.1 hypothetical protein [Bacilli bacterium]
MKSKKQYRIKLTKGEKILYSLAIICFLGTTVFKIFLGARIGHLNISVEKLKYEINEQEKKVEGLTMKINELTSFDKVKDVVKTMGLAYHNDNIIDVD